MRYDYSRFVKPIETHYKGYRFRSRLEARWAVFFDVLGVRYEYEPQGYLIPKAGGGHWSYLPDFRLLDLGTWVEVKGAADLMDDDYLNMLVAAMDWGQGLPGVSETCGTTGGLLILGPIPSKSLTDTHLPAHPILNHHEGVWLELMGFRHPEPCEICDTVGDEQHRFDGSWDDSAVALRPLLSDAIHDWEFYDLLCPDNVSRAYDAARSARFEHGENGLPRR